MKCRTGKGAAREINVAMALVIVAVPALTVVQYVARWLVCHTVWQTGSCACIVTWACQLTRLFNGLLVR